MNILVVQQDFTNRGRRLGLPGMLQTKIIIELIIQVIKSSSNDLYLN